MLPSFALLGGLVLFIYGMSIVTDGLRKAAGARLRSIVTLASKSRLLGISLGTLLGFLVHSSAATVMYVSLVDAGIMRLAGAIAPVMGANIGTTLSMQVISFHLTEYCYIALVVGAIIQFAAPREVYRSVGRAILGFGMLFLGMKVMTDAVKPYSQQVIPWLGQLDASTWGGILRGLLISTAITAVLQSSGATIGMCFALASAGVFTDIRQVFAIVLGAHIGTCITAILASIGTGINARRTALAHLAFNILGTILALIASPLLIMLTLKSSPDLVRQIANLHSMVMVFTTIILIPFIPALVRLVTLVTPSKMEEIETSFLDVGLLEKPERAIVAAVNELQRVARICADSIRLITDVMFDRDFAKVRRIKRNEAIVDQIKTAMKDYMISMTRRYLSRRQAILLQHLHSCMVDIERISDHIDSVCDLLIEQAKIPAARFDPQAIEQLIQLHGAACKVLDLVIESLRPEGTDFQAMAAAILQARDAYMARSLDAKAAMVERLAAHDISPLAGIYFHAYIAAFDRIVRHARGIALAERHPDFWIKRKKLDKVAADAPDHEPHPPPEKNDYLQQLQSEGLL